MFGNSFWTIILTWLSYTCPKIFIQTGAKLWGKILTWKKMFDLLKGILKNYFYNILTVLCMN